MSISTTSMRRVLPLKPDGQVRKLVRLPGRQNWRPRCLRTFARRAAPAKCAPSPCLTRGPTSLARIPTASLLQTSRASTPMPSLESEEAELRRSDALMRTFIDSLPGAVYRFALGPSWSLDFVSPGIEALTGLTAGAFLGFETVAHPDDAAGLRKAIETAIAANKPYSIEYRIRHAAGGDRWVYDNGQAVLDDRGVHAFLVGSIVDVTERHRTNEALRLRDEFFKALFENGGVGIMSNDDQGRFIEVNDT